MNRVSIRCLAFGALTLVAMMASIVNAVEDKNESQMSAVANLVQRVLDDTSGGDDAERLQRLQATLGKAARQLGPDHMGAQILLSALKSSKAAAPATRSEAISELRKSAEQVHAILTFEPVIESESPKGFPKWTPVGQIEVKKYPEYRMARLELKPDSRDSSAFFTLFNHIKSNNIEMTAPVEMDYRLSDESKPMQSSMAFLYGSTELGAVGETDSGVKIVDVPEKLVVSIGTRGPTSSGQVSQAHVALKAWLERNRAEYVADGKLRVMGHNSPFVIGDRRYFEVQMPVKSVNDAETR